MFAGVSSSSAVHCARISELHHAEQTNHTTQVTQVPLRSHFQWTVNNAHAYFQTEVIILLIRHN